MDCRLLPFNRNNGLFASRRTTFPGLSYRFQPRSFHCPATFSMKSYKLAYLTQREVDNLKARPRIDLSPIVNEVQRIIDDVRNRGDAAVKDYTLQFDKVTLNSTVENVNDLPDPVLDPAVREAFDVAYNNIFAFHAAQKPVDKIAENTEGVRFKRMARSISSVGLYVLGGTAILPSAALMLSVVFLNQPAQIAGCKTIVLATPPAQDGSICKEVLYCAKKAGVTHILKTGGAQAISAMAWGTASCPKFSWQVEVEGLCGQVQCLLRSWCIRCLGNPNPASLVPFLSVISYDGVSGMDQLYGSLLQIRMQMIGSFVFFLPTDK